MKSLYTSAVLVFIGSAAPALAQEAAYLRLDPNATRHVYGEGTVITPSSSTPEPAAAKAHTNVHIFQPDGVPPTRNVTHGVSPPVSGAYFETPESIACIYNFVTAVTGCNPDTVTTVPKGGSRNIAIVDAYNAPNALLDLTSFCLQFGLPLPTPYNFQVFYATSSGTIATTPPAYDAGWETEISLDIEWAHAMAPSAKIFLVEAASNSNADLLGAVQLANSLLAASGGGEVSMSWGSAESSGESAYDGYFTTSTIVYFAATGDSPGTEWPSVSVNVVAVGGTSISRNPETGNLVGEAAWYDGGGGQSLYVNAPKYQSSISSITGGHRSVPDLAAVANPRTGVWVYDSNAGGWIVVGGTSVASPVVAGLTNTIGHFNTSSNAELTQDYSNTSRFNDIKEGICGPNTGYWTAAGWDFCTGLGSLNGKLQKPPQQAKQ